ncbi:MAG: hypothetical protein BWX99_03022 [Deltaproteobacteria bacterium ADurb.Bin151]|nr:MAG: hypothetical protein BWX99_03022 [Deltaproteobacteria bacterium ADurb.Bin151]
MIVFVRTDSYHLSARFGKRPKSRIGSAFRGGNQCRRPGQILHDIELCGDSQAVIYNNSQRVAPADHSDRQRWIVLQHGSDSHQDSVVFGPELMGKFQRGGRTDPLRLAGCRGDAAVERLCVFHCHKRQAGFHEMKENLVEIAAFVLQNVCFDLNTRGLHAVDTFTGNQRVGISGANDDTLDFFADNQISAGRGFP